MARRARAPRARDLVLPAARDQLAPRSRDVTALAREHTADAVAALVKLLGADDEKLSIAAAVALLDRGWGRSGQPPEAGRPFAQVSDEKLTEAIELLRRAMAPARDAKQVGTP